MEFISAEEFLKQPKEVQEVFMEWWKCEHLDLYSDGVCDLYIKDFPHKDVDNINYFKSLGNIPLFTEGQLRKFIEDKTNGKVESYYAWDYYTIAIRDTECGGDDPQYDTEETDILQAYWEVACEIAKESVENE